MAHMTQAEWDLHKSIINEYQDDAFQEDITWLSSAKVVNRWGEEQQNFLSINILGLIQYNQFRSWPINKDKITGQIDDESCLLYLNIKYLRDNGYTNENDQFIFNPGLDKFIVNGVKYSPKGDSQTAQAKDTVLLHFIVLKRDEINTGNNIY